MAIQVPHFEQARVLIVGDVMLDRYWSGETDRISPEAPIPIVHVRRHDERPGGAANVALNVAALGAKATLMGLIGDDAEGRSLISLLTQVGIDCKLQTIANTPTITKLRVLSRHQQLLRLDFEEKKIEFSLEEQLDVFKKALLNTDIVILSDYRKGALKNAKILIKAARSLNIPVLVDPKEDDFSAYLGATLLTPNMKEFKQAVGDVGSLTALENKALAEIKRNEFDALLITRSEDGMSLITPKHDPVHIPTVAQEVFDVTGAGDTVIATLACAMAAGLPIAQAMMLSNLAAGISISKLGAATVSVAELEHALHATPETSEHVVNEFQLKELVKKAKLRGEKVVMTNGCFDILHAGHVAYLEEAKKQGSKLIVAVNSDESVQQLKGLSRPINSLETRMAVLAGLRSVDWVVPFSEETPARLIETILPDVLVKGGDYTPEQIAGANTVIKNGGAVKILCFKEGISTTQIIKKITGEKS